MKILVTYSSKTGNTKAVAEAIAEEVAEADLIPMRDNPSCADYDCIICGYWVDKGIPNAEAKTFIESLENKKVVLFGTLGAYPDGEHAQKCKDKAVELLDGKGNTLLGSWICMGKVDPKLLEMMAAKYGDAHPQTDERKARIEEGNKHPNEEDFVNAKAFVRECLEKA